MKPTATDAIAYLNRVAPDRKWEARDERIWEVTDSTHPLQHCFIEELHWMKSGSIGARGTALWIFEGDQDQPAVDLDNLKPGDEDHLKAIIRGNNKLASFNATPARQKHLAAVAAVKPESKRAQALKMYTQGMSRSEFVNLMKTKLNMTDAGAGTYWTYVKESK